MKRATTEKRTEYAPKKRHRGKGKYPRTADGWIRSLKVGQDPRPAIDDLFKQAVVKRNARALRIILEIPGEVWRRTRALPGRGRAANPGRCGVVTRYRRVAEQRERPKHVSNENAGGFTK
jgi:hypothetical protein